MFGGPAARKNVSLGPAVAIDVPECQYNETLSHIYRVVQKTAQSLSSSSSSNVFLFLPRFFTFLTFLNFFLERFLHL